jgi:iron(II)-dependent oxidoreductase
LLALLEPLDEDVLTTQHSPLMSPLVWDLAHVANYEEQWLLRALGRAALVARQVDQLYEATRHPRASRVNLPLLRPKQAFAYARDVREQVWDRLERLPTDSRQPLLEGGFLFWMVAQHEAQHVETVLATLALANPLPHAPRCQAPRPSPSTHAAPSVREVFVQGGPFLMGSEAPWAYDNERPQHWVEVPGFFIEATAVTNRAFLDFIEDGGYRRPALWSRAGWQVREEAQLCAPLHWESDGRAWFHRRYGEWVPLSPDEPVQHVCWFEADAYARWAKKRLPSEAEWEKAASWSEAAGKRPYPWGDARPDSTRANLDQRHTHPLPASATPEGAAPSGALQLLGDVWEWTRSDFLPYPGFQAFPYDAYSARFFGPQQKVLRGGSWGVAPVAARSTFRNWDFPIRRQIFAGFRCARDG